MEVKLHKPVQGKHGVYPADTWLEAKNCEGLTYVSVKDHPNMRLKLVDNSNIKETKE